MRGIVTVLELGGMYTMFDLGFLLVGFESPYTIGTERKSKRKKRKRKENKRAGREDGI